MRINTPPSQIRGPGFNLQPGDPEKPQTVRAELNTIAQPNTRPNTNVAVALKTPASGNPGGGGNTVVNFDLAKATGILSLFNGGTGVSASSDADLLNQLGVPALAVYILELP